MAIPQIDSRILDAFVGLEPRAVWAHFARICATPRPSKREDALRDALLAWAIEVGLEVQADEIGNLIIRKPASPGYESAPGVVMQGHLDMVCQKNAGCEHDFNRDPIVPVRQDGWLVTPDTTLGADNGLGIALILAVLGDWTLAHGPIEAVLTVDEEAGMGGARELAAGVLQGRLMLNLDTEDWGEFYLGCAGGLDVNAERPGCPELMPEGYVGRRIIVRGLRGGHSGVDIHEERGNAIKLLVRTLKLLEESCPIRLARVKGGTARNALPREAVAEIALPEGRLGELESALARIQEQLLAELKGVDEGLCIDCQVVELDALVAETEQRIWLDTLDAAPHGVHRMSRQVPGVVETSNNLGIVELSPQGGHANFMVRSLIDSGSLSLAGQIRSLWALSGTRVIEEGFYPGWAPNTESALLKVCQTVYRRDFGADSQVKVVHAGLECGIIGAKYPGMDIVSFGPTIRGAHAPGERVEIASVARCWQLLTAILRELH